MPLRIAAGALVLGLIAAGAAILAVAGENPSRAELGGAILSGGIVGGAFVVVERMLNAAAGKRNDLDRLRRQLENAESFPAIDLSNKDLSALYLPNRVLFDAVMTNANLAKATLLFSDLRHVAASHANFTGTDLSGANLSDATLTSADLTGADLTDAGLRNADLTQATLTGARLVRADLRGADLSGARLHQADLTGANLTGVTCEGTVWPEGFDLRKHKGQKGTDLSHLTLIDYLEYRKREEQTGGAPPQDRTTNAVDPPG